jgi:large subunit ribosomal protein L20
MRTTNAVARHKRAKNIRQQTKGMKKVRQHNLKMGRQAVVRSLQYAYRDRRNKKRDFRALWITRINAATRENGTTYAKLIAGLKKSNIELDRKILSELAVNQPDVFTEIVKTALK